MAEGIGDISNLYVKRLHYRDVPGAGKQIFADLSDGSETVVLETQLAAYEPWCQFPPNGRDNILDTLLQEMVSAWNALQEPEG